MLCAFMSSRGFRFMPPALILFRVNIAFEEKGGASKGKRALRINVASPPSLEARKLLSRQ